MNVKTAELRSFKSRASFIKSNNIIPILDFLKFEKGTITKNNLQSFVIQEIDCEGEFLVDESTLMSILDRSASPVINIEISDKFATLSDHNAKIKSPTETIELFPKNAMPDGPGVEISGFCMEAIKTASKFVSDDTNKGVPAHVFVGDSFVSGSNGFIAFFQPIEADLPKMVLSKEIINAISKFPTAHFSENESYYFFVYGNTTIGFSKPEQTYIDISAFAQFEKDVLPLFVSGKSEIIKFNEMCLGSIVAKFSHAVMDVNAALNLSLDDAGFSISISRNVEASGVCDHPFKFDCAHFNALLKSVPDEKLNFYQGDKKYYITGEPGFTALLLEII